MVGKEPLARKSQHDEVTPATLRTQVRAKHPRTPTGARHPPPQLASLTQSEQVLDDGKIRQQPAHECGSGSYQRSTPLPTHRLHRPRVTACPARRQRIPPEPTREITRSWTSLHQRHLIHEFPHMATTTTSTSTSNGASLASWHPPRPPSCAPCSRKIKVPGPTPLGRSEQLRHHTLTRNTITGTSSRPYRLPRLSRPPHGSKIPSP